LLSALHQNRIRGTDGWLYVQPREPSLRRLCEHPAYGMCIEGIPGGRQDEKTIRRLEPERCGILRRERALVLRYASLAQQPSDESRHRARRRHVIGCAHRP
jgi:hypothetical protein